MNENKLTLGIANNYGTYFCQVGWECPRCKKINSPYLDQCKCDPPTYANVSRTVELSGIDFTINEPIDESVGLEYPLNIDWNGLFGPYSSE